MYAHIWKILIFLLIINKMARTKTEQNPNNKLLTDALASIEHSIGKLQEYYANHPTNPVGSMLTTLASCERELRKEILNK
jgi:hypothetical protein